MSSYQEPKADLVFFPCFIDCKSGCVSFAVICGHNAIVLSSNECHTVSQSLPEVVSSARNKKVSSSTTENEIECGNKRSEKNTENIHCTPEGKSGN